MHFGHSNPTFDYYMKDLENLTKFLDKTKREKNLGVTFTPDLSFKYHILEITARVNRILDSFKRPLWVEILIFGKIYTFHYLDHIWNIRFKSGHHQRIWTIS